jgi:Ran GTPase-activating protein 1
MAAPTTAPSSKVFSILGKGLKANTAADLEPYLTQLKELEDVEEVHFGANSLGVEACEAIAEVLKEKKTLKVGWGSSFICRQTDSRGVTVVRRA